ncbi:MAG: molybdenum cofactor biosynthesis protein MoaE [Acidobacteriota bacterium]|jgi:molybdopterin synthase catalytic subunit|nr:molybdenum cofactor biosynthesis protein MoaE [Acidobacteriota bacterium]
MFQLTHEVIDSGKVVRALQSAQGGGSGALVVFEGVVRDNARDKAVRHLEYEAYEPMALKKLEEVGALAKEKFDILGIAIVHRLGRMEVGECSTLIVVASAHRVAAFDACRYAIDTIKQIVPIWKKEFYADGEVADDSAAWIEGVK